MTDFERLLTRTSRTFGISIPLLDEPHRRRLTLAYLIFRVADTLEDAEHLSRGLKLEALYGLRKALACGSRHQVSLLAPMWRDWTPTSHRGHQELLEELPSVVDAVADLGGHYPCVILHHACRTIDGMVQFIERSDPDGRLRLRSLGDLQNYCYAVAGIVGELITELLVAPASDPEAANLWRLAPVFGEGLQLVNILRDAEDDAVQGRTYLPECVRIQELFELARDDLGHAECYVEELRRRKLGNGIVPFAEFPLRLAQLTLN
jgi:farnesyl-diphosphate farnesyltransferase